MHITLLFCILGIFFSECCGMKRDAVNLPGAYEILDLFNGCQSMIKTLNNETDCAYVSDDLLVKYAKCKNHFDILQDGYLDTLGSAQLEK